MKRINGFEKIVILFDEQGTPTFAADRESNFCLGIGVTYMSCDEDYIFRACDKQFGLSNSRPLKNRFINTSRAVRISELLVNMPTKIVITQINLSTTDLQELVTLYTDLGNLMREIHRKIRGRAISQTLHTHLIDSTLFESITNQIEINQFHSTFSIFIDNWSIPINDVDIALNLRSQSLQEKINDLFDKHSDDLKIRVAPLRLLTEDNYRKRFIDIVASVVSRSFLKEKNERYSEEPLKLLLSNPNNKMIDITDTIMRFMRELMDEISRNN